MNIILENRFETMTKRLKHVKKPYSEDNLEGESAYDSDSEPEVNVFNRSFPNILNFSTKKSGQNGDAYSKGGKS